MKSIFRNSLVKPGAAVALAVAGLLGGGAAQAAETASGTDINNLATLTYAIGGTTQPIIGSSPVGNSTGGGTATTFKVDNKVNLSLTTTDTVVVSVAPGALNQVTTFSVTNLGNTTQGYTFVAVNTTGATIGGTADTIDVSNLRVFIESGSNVGYQAGEDTATAILTLAAGQSRTVYVVADVPVAAANGVQANVSLTATTTADGTATAVSQTTGADTPGAVDIVFADAATAELEFVGTSGARDGKATARDAYRIASAVVTVTKTVAPVCDPFNGTTNPKNIPGSFVRYTITVLNGGPTSVNLTSLADPLPATVTFDPSLITGAGTAPASCTLGTGAPLVGSGTGFQVSKVGGTRAGFPKSFTTSSSVDGVDLNSTTVNADFNLVLPLETSYTAGQLKSGESISLIFNVQVN